ncbi:MAG: malectin domain-containing carbohydrate-binding protein [Flavobacteriaceae bacterium]
MKKFIQVKLSLIFLVLSVSVVSVACGGDEDEPPIVAADPQPDATNANTKIEVTSPVVADSTSTADVTVTLADTNGNRFTKSGGVVTLSSTGDAVVSAVSDKGNGTYTATVTNTKPETVTISGSLGGTAITDTAQIVFTPSPFSDAGESTTPVGPTILKINCGGPEVTFGDITFLEDQYFNGISKTYTNPFVTEIAGTDLDAIFLTERVTDNNAPESPLSYDIPVTNGTYTVKLYFAEIFWGVDNPEMAVGGEGSRVFGIKMENKIIFNNLDIIKLAGTTTAVTKMYDIEVTDGVLNIVMISTVDRPKMSALEIFGAGSIVE